VSLGTNRDKDLDVRASSISKFFPRIDGVGSKVHLYSKAAESMHTGTLTAAEMSTSDELVNSMGKDGLPPVIIVIAGIAIDFLSMLHPVLSLEHKCVCFTRAKVIEWNMQSRIYQLVIEIRRRTD
jgi:hypothetical protein